MRRSQYEIRQSEFNNKLLVVVKGLGDNHLVMSENVVTVFDDMVTTIRKAQKDENEQ